MHRSFHRLLANAQDTGKSCSGMWPAFTLRAQRSQRFSHPLDFTIMERKTGGEDQLQKSRGEAWVEML